MTISSRSFDQTVLIMQLEMQIESLEKQIKDLIRQLDAKDFPLVDDKESKPPEDCL